jgi:DNA-directed RNA polymerase subunit H (RpoH/RPB5)
MANSSHIISVYNSRKNLLNMMEMQGYNVNDYKDFSIHELHSMFQSKQLDMLLNRDNTDNKKVYIKYHLIKTLRPNNIYEFIEDLYNLETILTLNDDLIIIIKSEPNETLIRLLKDIWEQDGIFIIIINIQRLQFNILNHSLIPKHTILDTKETNEFKIRYNIINNKQIADISRFSPVSQVIGIRPGQICKIDRYSKTAINTVFYRICTS